MGIVNRTPDSFYDGGRMDLARSVDFALKMVGEGAEVLDIGAVKAGPGPEVSEAEELARLIPLVEGIALRSEVAISVETMRPSVAEAAAAVGASIVNDVTGLQDPRIAGVCAKTGAKLVLMHSSGQVRGRPRHPRFDDVVAEVARDLLVSAEAAIGLGVPRDHVVIDPGLDFGKTTFHSLELMRRLNEITSLEFPVLVAPSRKDVVGETLDLGPGDRLEGTLALVALSVWQGASAVRVHDVQAAVRVVRMTQAVLGTVAPAVPLRGLWD
jgi:dihydropteroate synthase